MKKIIMHYLGYDKPYPSSENTGLWKRCAESQVDEELRPIGSTVKCDLDQYVMVSSSAIRELAKSVGCLQRAVNEIQNQVTQILEDHEIIRGKVLELLAERKATNNNTNKPCYTTVTNTKFVVVQPKE